MQFAPWKNLSGNSHAQKEVLRLEYLNHLKVTRDAQTKTKQAMKTRKEVQEFEMIMLDPEKHCCC